MVERIEEPDETKYAFQIEYAHRKFQQPLEGNTSTVDISGKWPYTILLERHKLVIAMDLYPEGRKNILFNAHLFSGKSMEMSLKMNELRGHMHTFLCEFYKVKSVCFRFLNKNEILEIVQESMMEIQSYLCLNFGVGVLVFK